MLLLDVVLGEGAHPDPAGELAPAIAECREIAGERLEVVTVVIGTDEDPQDCAGQVEQLRNAGARVFESVSAAVEYVAARFAVPAAGSPPVAHEALTAPVAAINVGVESFYESLKGQGAAALQVDWRPPAGGNEKMMDILARMKRS